MATGRTNASGGAGGLNFKLVGNPKPSSPPENTIWLNTDKAIAGYYFSDPQPEAMSEGEVWIQIGEYSAISVNVLKKNDVRVYPVRAFQYTGGALVEVNSEIYQDGIWRRFAYYLFKKRDITNVTGGWQSHNGSSWATTGTLTQDGQTLKVSTPQTSATSGGCIFGATAKTYDLTAFNYVYVHVKAIKNPSGCSVTVNPSDTLWNFNGYSAIKKITTTGWHVLDISEISGAHFVAVGIQASAASGASTIAAMSMTVDEVFLA